MGASEVAVGPTKASGVPLHFDAYTDLPCMCLVQPHRAASLTVVTPETVNGLFALTDRADVTNALQRGSRNWRDASTELGRGCGLFGFFTTIISRTPSPVPLAADIALIHLEAIKGMLASLPNLWGLDNRAASGCGYCCRIGWKIRNNRRRRGRKFGIIDFSLHRINGISGIVGEKLVDFLPSFAGRLGIFGNLVDFNPVLITKNSGCKRCWNAIFVPHGLIFHSAVLAIGFFAAAFTTNRAGREVANRLRPTI